MELNQDDFLKNQDDDLRNSADYDASADNDEIGENSEQTPVARAMQEEIQRKAENEGWENNKPGITAANKNNQQIPTVTPGNDNGSPGPEDDEFDDDDDNDELIPIETDDDAEFTDDEDDEDDDDILDKKKEKPHKETGTHHPHIDISHVTPSENRPFGRKSGRMIDHEPGITNNPD